MVAAPEPPREQTMTKAIQRIWQTRRRWLACVLVAGSASCDESGGPTGPSRPISTPTVPVTATEDCEVEEVDNFFRFVPGNRVGGGHFEGDILFTTNCGRTRYRVEMRSTLYGPSGRRIPQQGEPGVHGVVWLDPGESGWVCGGRCAYTTTESGTHEWRYRWVSCRDSQRVGTSCFTDNEWP